MLRDQLVDVSRSNGVMKVLCSSATGLVGDLVGGLLDGVDSMPRWRACRCPVVAHQPASSRLPSAMRSACWLKRSKNFPSRGIRLPNMVVGVEWNGGAKGIRNGPGECRARLRGRPQALHRAGAPADAVDVGGAESGGCGRAGPPHDLAQAFDDARARLVQRAARAASAWKAARMPGGWSIDTCSDDRQVHRQMQERIAASAVGRVLGLERRVDRRRGRRGTRGARGSSRARSPPAASAGSRAHACARLRRRSGGRRPAGLNMGFAGFRPGSGVLGRYSAQVGDRAAPALGACAPCTRSVRAGSASGAHPVRNSAGTAFSSAASTGSGCLARCDAGAVRHPEDVRVDRDRRLAERGVEHDVGGLAADARQGCSSASRERGTSPPCCSIRIRQASHQVLGLRAEQADRLDVGDQALDAEGEDRLRRVRDRQTACAWPALTLLSVAWADSSTAASNSNGVWYSSSVVGSGIERPQALERSGGARRASRLAVPGARGRLRMAASTTAAFACGGGIVGLLGRSAASLATARPARRSAPVVVPLSAPVAWHGPDGAAASRARRPRRDRGGGLRRRPGGSADDPGRMVMQSTGQAGTHRSQPLHRASITVCMRLGAPMIASSGQAVMHLVQPMQTWGRSRRHGVRGSRRGWYLVPVPAAGAAQPVARPRPGHPGGSG
jgi:hypothetical protein